MRITLSFVLLINFFILGQGTMTRPYEVKLLRDKFYGQSLAKTIPSSPNSTFAVDIEMDIERIKLDEEARMLEISGVLLLRWQAAILKWDPKHYGNLEAIRLKYSIWRPDIQVIEGFTEENLWTRKSSNSITTLIHSSGHVFWVPRFTFRSYCDLDQTNFPFDVQQCHMTIGSWSYTLNELNFTYIQYGKNANRLSNLDGYQENPEWTVKSIEESKSKLSLTMHLKVSLERRAPIYTATIVTPMGVGTFLAILVFLIPQNDNQKIILGAVSISILMALLFHLAWALPTAIIVPKIVTVCRITLIAVCSSLMCSVTLLNIRQGSFIFTKEPPGCAVNILQRFGKWGLCTNMHEKSKIQSQELALPTDSYVSDALQSDRQVKEWKLIGTAIDRILFVIFSIAFMTITLG